MNLSLPQLNATTNTLQSISNIAKHVLYLFFLFCLMLNYNPILAQANDCPEGDALQWDWIQDLIAASDGNYVATIHQFKYDGNTYFKTINSDTNTGSYYVYYDCGGKQVCEYVSGNDYNPCYDISTYNTNIQLSSVIFTIIWSFEDPYPPGICPEEEDPLEWDWIKDLIALENECKAGTIRQFEYNDNTYFSVGEGGYCGIADNGTFYYNCAGDTVCVSGHTTSCDEIFRQAARNSTTIWTYDYYIAETCPDGYPEQWDWTQEVKDNINGCGETEIIEIEVSDFKLYHFWNECDSVKDQFYDCQGKIICGEGPDAKNGWLCIDLTEFMRAYIPPICPEGDEPLQWDWMRDLIIEYSDCEVREIRQFEYRGRTYFKTIANDSGMYPCDEFWRGYFNCGGGFICDDGENCSPEMVAAANNYETIWLYRDGIPPAPCPKGDPLQLDWIQDLIALEDDCFAGKIWQFDYDGETYFGVGQGQYCNVADLPTAYYYNCEGDTLCLTGAWIGSTCGEVFPGDKQNSMTIWTSEPPITSTCMEGDPEQWEWVQEMKDNINGCGETEIINITWEDFTIIHFWNACDSLKDQFYDCQGNLVCAEGLDVPVRFSRVCDFFTDIMQEYTPQNIACPEGDPLQWNWLQEKIANSGCEIKEIRQFEYNGSTHIGVLDNIQCIQDGGFAYYDCMGNSVCAYNLWFDTCNAAFDAATNSATTIYTNPFDAIIYPQSTYAICSPVSVSPLLTVEDFSTTGDEDFLSTLSLEFVEERIDVQQYFNSTNRLYLLRSSTGNYVYFSTTHHIANQILDAPQVSQSGVVCEEDLWSYVKMGTDQYKIYADNNGTKGEVMSTCNTPSLICSTADLGVDTKVPGQYNFWTTTYFEFPDGSICESEPSLFYADVQPKPVAELTVQNKTVNIGEGTTLMDLVTDNKNGFWTGENITYLITVTGQNIAYFSTNNPGVYKLYYTVSNEFCERSYLMIVEVNGSSSKPEIIAGINSQNLPSFNVYPNPATRKVFIDFLGQSIEQINLMDISGKVMRQIETEATERIIEIDVNDLPKGMYLLELKNEQNHNIKKLIVE